MVLPAHRDAQPIEPFQRGKGLFATRGSERQHHGFKRHQRSAMECHALTLAARDRQHHFG